MSIKEKILTFGMVCSIALLGFVAGAVVTGNYAFADIPSNLKGDVLAYNNDIAYVSLDSVDHIVIYMHDGSTKVGSKSRSDTASDSVKTAVQPEVASVPANGLEVGEDYVASPPMGGPSDSVNGGSQVTGTAGSSDKSSHGTSEGSGRSSSSGHSDGSGSSSDATDLNGIPLPPSSLTAVATTANSDSPAKSEIVVVPEETTAAAVAQQPRTTIVQPNITIQNTTPEVKVVTQNPAASNVSTVSTNYNYYDYVSKDVNLTNSSLNNGTVVSVDYKAMVDKLLDSMKTNPDIAKQISNLPGLTINTNTVNNANNDGVIVQNSDNAKVVSVKDATIDVNSTVQNSNNTDSLNTTMNNVGNKVNDNVGNTVNAAINTSTNNQSNNSTSTSLQNVANNSSTTSTNANVQKTTTDVNNSLNGAGVVQASGVNNSGVAGSASGAAHTDSASSGASQTGSASSGTDQAGVAPTAPAPAAPVAPSGN